MEFSASASSPAEDYRHTVGSDESRESSSIGTPGESEEEEEGEEENDDVSSWKKDVGLQMPRNKFSMDSIEDSLPSKRSGLSNHYSGKSKSFANLTEVTSMSTAVKDLEKQENPFNKRRRLLIANKWSRRFFYSRGNPNSMPLLPILPDDVEQQQNSAEYVDDHKYQHHQVTSKQDLHVNKLQVQMAFKSQSCFCLADLAEEEEEEKKKIKINSYNAKLG